MTSLSNFKPVKTKLSIFGHTLDLGTARNVNQKIGVIVLLVLRQIALLFHGNCTLVFGGNHVGFSRESHWVFVGITLDFRSNRVGFSQDGISFS